MTRQRRFTGEQLLAAGILVICGYALADLGAYAEAYFTLGSLAIAVIVAKRARR